MPTTTAPCDDLVLAADPFVANRYHFGMLLGVDDLETDQSYHRGKAWLHAAWLHGAGTVWGLEVLLSPSGLDEEEGPPREVVVLPGLAIDRRGREVPVHVRQCVDILAWVEEHRADLEVEEDEETGERTVRAHVVVCADPCRTRPVPSIADTCDVDADRSDTAYSRTNERGHVEMRPGPAPAATTAFPRLSAFMGTVPGEPDAEPADAEPAEEEEAAPEEEAVPAVPADVARADAQLAALDARLDADAALSDAERCAMKIRGRAALDAMARRPEPGANPFPVLSVDACVLLADVVLVLADAETGEVVVGPSEDGGTRVDNTVRPAHVDTTTLLGLLSCPPAV